MIAFVFLGFFFLLLATAVAADQSRGAHLTSCVFLLCSAVCLVMANIISNAGTP